MSKRTPNNECRNSNIEQEMTSIFEIHYSTFNTLFQIEVLRRISQVGKERLKKTGAFFLFILCLGLHMLVALPARAQPSGAEFLQIGAGGRGLGMGSAQVALVNDYSSGFWNPAGIASVPGIQGYVSHMNLFNGLAGFDFVAATVPLGRDMSLAVSAVRLSVDDIPRYGPLQGTRFDRFQNPALRSTGEADGFFGSRDSAVLFTFGKKYNLEFLFGGGLAPHLIPVAFAIGANLKFIHRQLDNATATAQGLDLGAIVQLLSPGRRRQVNRALAFGVSLFDLATSRVNWTTASRHTDPLPLRLVFGMAFQQSLPGLQSEINFSLDARSRNLNNLNVGGEYVYRRTLALRAGLTPQGWTAGAGLMLGRVMVDYTFATHDLGGSHRVGGGVRL